MYSEINPYFILGIVLYLAIFLFAYRNPRARGQPVQKPAEKIKILRLSIAALAISISLMIFGPQWGFGQEVEGYGIDRMILLGTAVISLVSLYVSFRRETRR